MARTSLLGLGFALAGALSIGCGGAPLTVVSQASPDPFVGQGRFGVLPLDFTEARIDGKAESKYLDGKDEKARDGLAEGKVALDDGFRRALREAGGKRGMSIAASETQGDAPFTVRASVGAMDPDGGRVDMTVQVVGAEGNVLDEIQVSHGGEALRADGEALGTAVADYLQSRVGKIRAAVTMGGDPPSPPARPVADEAPAAPPPPPAAAPPPPAVAPPPPPPPAAPARAAAKAKRPPPPVKRPGKHPAQPPVPAPPPGTPIAGAPGFARLPDGTSRIWIEVNKKVEVAEKRSVAHASYFLRGTVVLTPTNELPLPTEFFTTPVMRVQLVPEGSDLVLSVDLREDVTPVYRVIETPRGMVLQIDVPRGIVALPSAQPVPDEPASPRRRRSRSTQTLGKPGPAEE